MRPTPARNIQDGDAEDGDGDDNNQSGIKLWSVLVAQICHFLVC